MTIEDFESLAATYLAAAKRAEFASSEAIAAQERFDDAKAQLDLVLARKAETDKAVANHLGKLVAAARAFNAEVPA